MRVRFGFHFSIAGGIDKSVLRCLELGCNAIQIFTGNPRSLFFGELKEEEVASFKSLVVKHDIWPVVVHTNYLINLASRSRFLVSFESFYEECKRSYLLGTDYVVLHPGSLRDNDRNLAIVNIAYAINRVLEDIPAITILIENTSGAGSQLGSCVEDLVDIFGAVLYPDRLGLCFDTAHAFQAGYPIHTSYGFYEFLRMLDRRGLLDRVKLIHLNDSKTKFSSKVDRHHHLSSGYIGESLKVIAKFFSTIGVPIIMETPWGKEEDLRNLKILLDWLELKY